MIVEAGQGRSEFFAAARDLTPLVGIDYREMRFVVPTGDENLGRQFFTKGRRSELGCVLRAGRALRRFGALRGSVFVDVGANIGTTTIPALIEGKLARAVAIEPAPDNLRLLRANLALNDLLDRVTIVEAAAADAEGEGFLHLNDHNIGDHRVAHDGVPIRLVTLDSLGLEPDDVALLWMDVQRHEGHVLAGAQQLVGAGVPFVIEYFPEILKEAGTWAMVCEAIGRYESVLDLRVKEGVPIPASDAVDVVQRRLDEIGRRYTDLLVFGPR